jgi:hypothetical protein
MPSARGDPSESAGSLTNGRSSPRLISCPTSELSAVMSVAARLVSRQGGELLKNGQGGCGFSAGTKTRFEGKWRGRVLRLGRRVRNSGAGAGHRGPVAGRRPRHGRAATAAITALAHCGIRASSRGASGLTAGAPGRCAFEPLGSLAIVPASKPRSNAPDKSAHQRLEMVFRPVSELLTGSLFWGVNSVPPDGDRKSEHA